MIGLSDLRFLPHTKGGVTTEKAVAALPDNLRLSVTRRLSPRAAFPTYPEVLVQVLRGDKRFPDSYEVHASVSRYEVDEDELGAIIYACQIEVLNARAA